jgi:hypothetical protein
MVVVLAGRPEYQRPSGAPHQARIARAVGGSREWVRQILARAEATGELTDSRGQPSCKHGASA